MKETQDDLSPKEFYHQRGYSLIRVQIQPTSSGGEYDTGTGKVFCLVEAPSKEAASAVRREAHGLVADEIVEVKASA